MFRTRMALTYFEDAENQESPVLFEKLDWKKVKEAISKEVRQFDWNKYIEQ